MAFGLHYSDTLAGRVFSQVPTPAGLALPLYTTTVMCTTGICGMPIWNPPGSNRNVELITADFAYDSGTAVAGSILLMGVPTTQIGSAGPVTAMLQTSPINNLLGSGNQTKIWSYNSVGAVTMTAAGTTLPPSSTAAGPIRVLGGLNNQTTATPTAVSVASYDFKGTVIVTPGYFIYLATTLASVGLYCTCLLWKEIPIVPSQG